MMTLDHPNIVRLYEVFDTPSKYSVVMELATGGDLSRRIRRRPLPEDHAKRILRELCSALTHVHARGIVHRDLKPENVLFMSRGEDATIKVTDFGFATRRLLGGKLALPKVVNEAAWLTKRKHVTGTPWFVAPEVITRSIYSPACDLWATGVIAYMCLRARPPFDAPGTAAILEKIRKCEWDHCEGEAWANVSTEARHLIQALLQPDYMKRLSAAGVLAHSWIRADGEDYRPAMKVACLFDGDVGLGGDTPGELDERIAHGQAALEAHRTRTQITPR